MKVGSSLLTSAATIALTVGASSAKADDYYLSFFGGMFQQNDSIHAQVGGIYTNRQTLYQYTTPTGTALLYSSTKTAYTTFGYGAAFEVDYSDGWTIGAAIGKSLANNIRGEFEVAFRGFDAETPGRADIYGSYRFATFDHDSVYAFYSRTGTVTGTARLTGDGDVTAWSFMTNLWYDFDLGDDSKFMPFIGGGIGAANVSVNYSGGFAGTLQTNAYSGSFTGAANTSFDDSSWTFAYQLGAGLGYDLGNGTTISAQYRYFGTTEAEVGPIDQRVGGHNFLIGISLTL